MTTNLAGITRPWSGAAAAQRNASSSTSLGGTGSLSAPTEVRVNKASIAPIDVASTVELVVMVSLSSCRIRWLGFRSGGYAWGRVVPDFRYQILKLEEFDGIALHQMLHPYRRQVGTR